MRAVPMMVASVFIVSVAQAAKVQEHYFKEGSTITVPYSPGSLEKTDQGSGMWNLPTNMDPGTNRPEILDTVSPELAKKMKDERLREASFVYKYGKLALLALNALVNPTVEGMILIAGEFLDLSTLNKVKEKINLWKMITDNVGICKGCDLKTKTQQLEELLANTKLRIDAARSNPMDRFQEGVDVKLALLHLRSKKILINNNCGNEVKASFKYRNHFGDISQSGAYTIKANTKTFLRYKDYDDVIKTMGSRISVHKLDGSPERFIDLQVGNIFDSLHADLC